MYKHIYIKIFLVTAVLSSAELARSADGEKKTPRERMHQFLDLHREDDFKPFWGYSAIVRGNYGIFSGKIVVHVYKMGSDYNTTIVVNAITGEVDSEASSIPITYGAPSLSKSEVQIYKNLASKFVSYEVFNLYATEDGEVHVSLKFDKNSVQLLKLKEGRTPLDVYKIFDERTIREKIGDWYLVYRTDLETGMNKQRER